MTRCSRPKRQRASRAYKPGGAPGNNDAPVSFDDIDMQHEVLLGTVMLEPSAWGKVEAAGIRADDFRRPELRRLFETVAALACAGRPFDAVAIFKELELRSDTEALAAMAPLLEKALAATAPVADDRLGGAP